MKRATIFLAVLAVVAGGTGAQKGDKQQEERKSTDAHALLRVVADPDSGLANRYLITALLQHDEVIRAAIRDVIGETNAANEARPHVHIYVEDEQPAAANLPPGLMLLKVGADSFDPRVSAEKLLRAIAVTMGSKLSQLDPMYYQSLIQGSSHDSYVKDIKKRLEAARETLANLAHEHKTTSDPHMADERARLQADKQAAEVRLKAVEARRNSLKGLITDLQSKISKPGLDLVAKELERTVQIRAKILETVKTEHSANDVLAAEEELARAKAEWARYQQQLAAAAGGDRIAELEQQVQNATVEIAELLAERQALEELLESRLPPGGDIFLAHSNVEALEQSYREFLEESAKQAARAYARIQPQVTVIAPGPDWY
jgi:hypothetical protein